MSPCISLGGEALFAEHDLRPQRRAKTRCFASEEDMTPHRHHLRCPAHRTRSVADYRRCRRLYDPGIERPTHSAVPEHGSSEILRSHLLQPLSGAWHRAFCTYLPAGIASACAGSVCHLLARFTAYRVCLLPYGGGAIPACKPFRWQSCANTYAPAAGFTAVMNRAGLLLRHNRPCSQGRRAVGLECDASGG
jgi:hypothetical protein